MPGTLLRSDFLATAGITSSVISLIVSGVSRAIGERSGKRKVGVFEVGRGKVLRRRFKTVVATPTDAATLVNELVSEIGEGRMRWSQVRAADAPRPD